MLRTEGRPAVRSRLPLNCEYGAQIRGLRPVEDMDVAENLAEAEPELSLFVCGRQALDFDDNE